MRRWCVMAAVAAAVVQLAHPASARDNIWIVTAPAALPFTKAVAERAAKAAGAPAPIVDDAETTLGFQYLCGGTGADYPDAVGATRRMTKPEFDACRKNGIAEIVEIPVGLDLLVVAQSKTGPAMRLTVKQLFLALGRQFPDEYGEMGFNPYKKWSEIDKSLPDSAIEVRVLQRFSSAREALQELLLQKGARSIPRIAKQWARAPALPKSVWEMREDHPFVVVHENEDVIARQLARHPTAIGVLDFRFLEANNSTLRAVEIDGAEPTPEKAYAGKYPGTRTLYLYLKKTAIDTVPGLSKLGAEYISSAALGADGYLLKLGFVPLQMDAMIKTLALTKTLPPVQRETLPDF